MGSNHPRKMHCRHARRFSGGARQQAALALRERQDGAWLELLGRIERV
jgi:hypothetical protein